MRSRSCAQTAHEHPASCNFARTQNPAAGARGAASTSTASSSREASSTSASSFVEKTPSQETRASERVALASLMALTVGFR